MSVTATRAQALAEAAARIGRREARELLLQVCGCTHAELIARGGTYARLQAMGIEPDAP